MKTNPSPRHEGEHLSAETLAVLAEHGHGAEVDRRSVAHLAQCRSCMAAYSDAVRYRTAWLGSPEMFEESGAEIEPLRTRSVRRYIPLGLAAAFLLVVGVGAWMLSRRSTPGPATSAPIAALLEHASASDLVLPGGERGAMEPALPYREGVVEDRAGREAIQALRVRYEKGERNLSDLYLLAALVTASGRTDLAHDYVEEGRRLAPGHTGFLLLEAVLARREGRLERADQLLREARGLAPDDPTLLLDHAIVLQEKGDTDGAAPLLQEVIRRAPRSPLAQRAQSLLAATEPR